MELEIRWTLEIWHMFTANISQSQRSLPALSFQYKAKRTASIKVVSSTPKSLYHMVDSPGAMKARPIHSDSREVRRASHPRLITGLSGAFGL